MQSILQNEQEFSSEMGINQIKEYLNKIMYALFILAALRLYSLQFLWIINDLITALIIKCLIDTSNKCIAIFSLINSLLAIVYSIISTIFMIPFTFAKFSVSIHTTIVIGILGFSIFIYTTSAYFSYLSITHMNKIILTEQRNIRSGDYETFAHQRNNE